MAQIGSYCPRFAQIGLLAGRIFPITLWSLWSHAQVAAAFFRMLRNASRTSRMLVVVFACLSLCLLACSKFVAGGETGARPTSNWRTSFAPPWSPSTKCAERLSAVLRFYPVSIVKWLDCSQVGLLSVWSVKMRNYSNKSLLCTCASAVSAANASAATTHGVHPQNAQNGSGRVFPTTLWSHAQVAAAFFRMVRYAAH